MQKRMVKVQSISNKFSETRGDLKKISKDKGDFNYSRNKSTLKKYETVSLVSTF